MEQLTAILNQLSAWLYAPYVLIPLFGFEIPFPMLPVLLVFAGAYLTYQSGMVQIRHFGTAVKEALGGMFGGADKGEGTITSFQALSTALASTVGNGNIGGVATAIVVGGPGAIFWMWVTAAVGMATKYSEAVLGVHYRVRTETGEMASGPMYYITNGLKENSFAKPLAYMFCIFGAATALLGTGNMAQSNTIAQTFMQAARNNFEIEVSPLVPGLLITVACGLVLLGGIKRIAMVSEKLVPSMIVVYLVMGITYVVMNVGEIPGVFGLIISHAFTPMAAVGGFVGAGVSQAVAAGVSRGVPLERSRARKRTDRSRHRESQPPDSARARRRVRGLRRHDRGLQHDRVHHSLVRHVVARRISVVEWRPDGGGSRQPDSDGEPDRRGVLVLVRLFDAHRLVLLRREVHRVHVRHQRHRAVPGHLHGAHSRGRGHPGSGRVGYRYALERVHGLSQLDRPHHARWSGREADQGLLQQARGVACGHSARVFCSSYARARRRHRRPSRKARKGWTGSRRSSRASSRSST